ncbi:trypsin-like serine protease [Streptomyces sp. NBC_00846]|uniref:S1 family peptidase n=1 Tax=Streptomyces sp. NBC_00846 TaxID=2975849 RepID=UPI00386E99FC|nr:trypsin-like serine protease [Streptomyces sp. NBC_00846]
MRIKWVRVSVVAVSLLALVGVSPASANGEVPPAPVSSIGADGDATDGDVTKLGQEGPEARIVNGELADSSRGMAALHVYGGFECSASIVHDRWVLTAKHCLYNGSSRYPDSSMTVRVKSLDRTSGGGVINISLSKVRTNNDIAMLKLDRSANAEPVSLATANPKWQATTYAFGWGATCASCGSSRYLKRATQYVASVTWTDKYGGEGIRVLASNGAVCYGDSGGPLFKLVDGKRYQVGVLSGGDKECAGRGDTYSSVPRSLAWIQDVIDSF